LAHRLEWISWQLGGDPWLPALVGMKRLGVTATKNLDSTYQALFA
jgi:hypothetical protein